MIEENYHRKHYGSASRRFLEPQVAALLERELVRMGPELCRMLAERIVELLDSLSPPTERLQPGQLLWLALDRHTRGGSRNERLRPVVLTLLSEQDADALAAGEKVRSVRCRAVARLFQEAAEQGALLSSRDLALILHVGNGRASQLRMAAEAKLGHALPHPGTLHDMGSTITHKVDIVRKAIVERMDPVDVARATRHSQVSVDRYLKDFHRIRSIHNLNPDPEYIHFATGYSKSLIHQYINLIQDIDDHE